MSRPSTIFDLIPKSAHTGHTENCSERQNNDPFWGAELLEITVVQWIRDGLLEEILNIDICG
jgi:hypothetical protein